MNNKKLTREERLKLNAEEQVFFILQGLVAKKKISLIMELNKLLNTTKNHEIRDSVAKVLYRFKDKTSLKFFINAIKQPYTINHRGYLVLCCDAFNCSSYLMLFLNLVFTENYYTTINAALIIKQMDGPFKKGKLKKANSLLSGFLKENQDSERIDIINDLLEFLNSRQN